MTKVHLNNLGIILGTKCNLRCPHCMGGDPKEQITIHDDYIDDLIPNITGIDELSFIGYEPTLYIREIKMIFDKLLNAKIRINRFTMYTNAVVYSQQLTDLVKHYRNYVTYPDKVMMHYSDDIFHYHNGFTKEKMNKNVEKYTKELDNCQISIQTFSPETEALIIQGRAKNLTKNYIDKIAHIEIPVINTNFRVEFRKECKGKQNTCNNGNLICNCIVSQIIMTPDGYIFINDGMAFDAIATKNYTQSIGHISNMSLYEMVENQNNKYSNSENNTLFVRFQNKHAIDWYIQKLVYDYILFVNQIYQAIKNNNQSLYLEIKVKIKNELDKIQNLIYKSNDSQAIEYSNIVYENLKADYQALTGVADWCFSIMKPLFIMQIELYKDNTLFKNSERFRITVGIDYSQFMDLWRYYYQCDYENYKKTALEITRSNIEYLKKNKAKTN